MIIDLEIVGKGGGLDRRFLFNSIIVVIVLVSFFIFAYSLNSASSP